MPDNPIPFALPLSRLSDDHFAEFVKMVETETSTPSFIFLDKLHKSYGVNGEAFSYFFVYDGRLWIFERFNPYEGDPEPLTVTGDFQIKQVRILPQAQFILTQ